jgi:hypothetical protein
MDMRTWCLVRRNWNSIFDQTRSTKRNLSFELTGNTAKYATKPLSFSTGWMTPLT